MELAQIERSSSDTLNDFSMIGGTDLWAQDVVLSFKTQRMT